MQNLGKSDLLLLSASRATLFTLVFAYVFLILPPAAVTANYDPSDFDQVLEDFNHTSELKLHGSEWDNTLVRNCKIHDTSGDGIDISNARNVVVTDCEIYNISGDGIRVAYSNGGTDDVIIDGNDIHDIGQNGIAAPERTHSGANDYARNLKILNNHIEDTGLNASSGQYHGMYIQTLDPLIEDNTVSGTRDGNGISIRSSGIIRGNTVHGTSKNNKPAIRYFSDHEHGPSDTLIIENNIAYSDGTSAPVFDMPSHAPLYETSAGGTAHVVKKFIIRFNTFVSFNAASPISVHSDYQGNTFGLDVYGNILIHPSGKSAIVGPVDRDSKNFKSTSLAGFERSSAPYDFHITSAHGAAAFATNETGSVPTEDIDGDNRGTALDAGADQISTASQPSGPAQSSACETITSGQSVTAGFGVPWNTLSSARELLIVGTCAEDSIAVAVGKANNQFLAVYEQSYVYEGVWKPIMLSGTARMGNSPWFTAYATSNISRTPAELSDGIFYAAYVCQWVTNQWKCGCRDQACTTSYWQLQFFKPD